MSLLILLSPAKKQVLSSPSVKCNTTRLRLQAQTATLVNILKQSSANELAKQLNISAKLGALNYQRYQAFSVKQYNKDNAAPCLWTFQGDVYRMLAAERLTTKNIAYAQHHLRILSGLYGLLRPLDLIQLYRLEMGCKINYGKGDSLYDFWGTTVTDLINKDTAGDFSCIINLASKEYSQVIQQTRLAKPMIEIGFRQMRNGELKNIGILGKHARGQMARFIIEQQISDVNKIKAFNIDGYQFNPGLSGEATLIFVTKKS